jgi:4-amino-4-deoxy-L-arabinose transferase-like glycosyltransferase
MLAFAIALPALVGYMVYALLSRGDPAGNCLEGLLFGFGIGTGLITFELFLLGLSGIKFSAMLVSMIQIVSMVALGAIMVQFGSARNPLPVRVPEMGQWNRRDIRGGMSVLMVLLAAWIMLKLAFVLSEGLLRPVNDWDSWAIWSSGAKFFFYERGLALNSSSEHFFGAGYRPFLSYPLLVSLMQTWIALCIGGMHEVFVKLGSILYYTGIIGLLFSSVRRESSTLPALLAALLIASVPLLTYHALTAYADLPLSYYVLAAAICLRRFMQTETETTGGAPSGYLVLTGIFAAFCVWTKGEGLFYAVAITAVLLSYLLSRKLELRGMLRAFGLYAAPLATVCIPWFVFLTVNRIPLGRGETFFATGPHWEVLPVIADQAFLSSNFNIIFPVFSGLLLFGMRDVLRTDLRYLVVMIFVVMAEFLFIYITTENYQWVMSFTSVDRNILTFVPTLFYVSALLAVRVISRKDVA